MISPLFKGALNPEQRKAPSRSSVRNTAEFTPPDTASQSQASAELPSPAKPKRARIAAKLEKEEPTSVELVSKGVVGRAVRHERNHAEGICRFLPRKPRNLRRQVGDAGYPNEPLRKLRRVVRQFWFSVHPPHPCRQTHLYLLYLNLRHPHQLRLRLLRSPPPSL